MPTRLENILYSAIVLAALVLLPGALQYARAQPASTAPANLNYYITAQAGELAVRGFGATDRRIITSYFTGTGTTGAPTARPTGLRRGDTLPRQSLPTPLPVELDVQLDAPPHGTQRLMLDADIVLLDVARRRIIDIISFRAAG